MKTILIVVASGIAGVLAGKLGAMIAAKVRAKKADKKKTKVKPMGVMDKALLLEAVVLIAYTAVVLALFYTTDHGEPSTLTTCVFAVWSFENGIMGWIKTTKDKQGATASSDPEGGEDQ